MKHLILFALYSVGILVLHTLNALLPMISDVNKNIYSFFTFSNFSFFVFVFTNFKKKISIFIFLSFIRYCPKSKHFNITVSILWLPNQFRKHCRFKQQPFRGRYSIFPGRGKNLIWEDLTVYGEDLITLRNHVILSSPNKFMSSYLYISNNLKDLEDHI